MTFFIKKRKTINYSTSENRPKQFPLMGVYPVNTQDLNKLLDAEIDMLIEKTDLIAPNRRVCICISDEILSSNRQVKQKQ